MANGTTSWATDSTKPSMPHFVAWYIELPGKATCPPHEEIWMMRPPPCAGAAARRGSAGWTRPGWCEDVVVHPQRGVRTRWAAQNVRYHRTGIKHVHHPDVGDCT
jgi:hypothetical protein